MATQFLLDEDDRPPNDRPPAADAHRTVVKWSIALFAILILVIVCSALLLRVHMAATVAENGAGSGVADGPAFQLSGVPLGLTPAELGAMIPGIDVSPGEDMEMNAEYRIGNGIYRTSFLGPSGGTKSYRVEYRETFAGLTGAEVRQYLVRKFGLPDHARCNPINHLPRMRCRFHWAWTETTDIEAITATPSGDSALTATSITLIAVDRRRPSGTVISTGPSRGRHTGTQSRFEAISAGLRAR